MSNELTTDVRPDYLQEYNGEDFGTQELLKIVRPAMIKIVQALTGPPVKPPFEDGDVVVTPPLIKLGGGKNEVEMEYFEVVPIFFFRNWFTWNPLQMKNLSSVREMSFDENGSIAKKARNPETRKEACPENPEFKMLHCEHLNYIVLTDNKELKDVPLLLSFARSEYMTGSTFGSLIQVRNAPIYCCKFQIGVRDVVGTLGKWKGFDISNSLEPWVSQEEAERNKELHKKYKELHESRSIEVEFEESTEPEANEFS